jgi:hypothetical protein
MSDPLWQLRVEIVEAHGLPARAAALLVGETVEQLERQADGLAALLALHGGLTVRQPRDVVAVAAGERERRRRELVDALSGRLP